MNPSVWWATPHRHGIKVWLSHRNELTHVLKRGDGRSVQERRTPPVGEPIRSPIDMHRLCRSGELIKDIRMKVANIRHRE
jgi:hypothetical protein